MAEHAVPTYDQLMQPTIDGLKRLGGEATNTQIYEQICSDLELPKDVISIRHSDASRYSEVEYRLMWTRTYLKRYGLLHNPLRGVWKLTDQAYSVGSIDPRVIVRSVKAQMRAPQEALSRQAAYSGTPEQNDVGEPTDQVSDQLNSPTPLYPSYTATRHFLTLLDGVPYADFRELDNEIRAQHGSPQDQVDWANPEEWIGERLTPSSQMLAYRLWRNSKHSLNPRYMRGCWYLCSKHDLLYRNSEDSLQMTDLGREFFEHPAGQVEAEIDAYEGVLTVLRIVSERGPGRRSDLLPVYEEYALAHTTARSDNVIKSYLYARLKNLIARGMVSRSGQRYEITDSGLSYLAEYAALVPGLFVTSEKQSDIRRLAKDMREDTRAQLREFLHTMDPYKFEYVVQLLLEEMGYDNVETTAPTNDKGVDVVGDIELGISSVREVIQAKRHRGRIGRPVLDQLRGSLYRFNAVRGTIITTGQFSKGARDAAFERGAPPITLIDGEKLLDLLMDNELGVTKRSVEYFDFVPDALLGSVDST